jgi:hypothetical protein
MRNKLTSLVTAALLVILGVGVAAAQTAHTVKVDVPFAFTAGNTQLPAGTYVISMYRQAQLARVTSSAGVGQILMLANVVGTGDRTDARLVFDKIGDSYLLRNVEAPDLEMTFGVEKAEHRLEASHSNSNPTPISVAAVRL